MKALARTCLTLLAFGALLSGGAAWAAPCCSSCPGWPDFDPNLQCMWNCIDCSHASPDFLPPSLRSASSQGEAAGNCLLPDQRLTFTVAEESTPK
jgi:hypothetical protein